MEVYNIPNCGRTLQKTSIRTSSKELREYLMKVDGLSAIITGSSIGIGRAIAVELARRGAQVVCTARSEARLRETVDAIKSEGGVALAAN